jgi:hypothetical protein
MDARRPLLMLLATMAAGVALAQAPAKTQPLPQPPPPPPDVIGESELEPQAPRRERRNLHPARQPRFVAEGADVGVVLVLSGRGT